jgi:hypothetical protein
MGYRRKVGVALLQSARSVAPPTAKTVAIHVAQAVQRSKAPHFNWRFRFSSELSTEEF